jgi:hypothetical protein
MAKYRSETIGFICDLYRQRRITIAEIDGKNGTVIGKDNARIDT